MTTDTLRTGAPSDRLTPKVGVANAGAIDELSSAERPDHACGTVDDVRWQAVLRRDASMDGAFVYAVKTTSVYCRPSCASRRAKRQNVAFYDLPREAESAGFRACLRCRPTEPSTLQRNARMVEAACRTLETATEAPSLADLAAAAGNAPHHFHRIFKAHTGLTPLAWYAAARSRRAADALEEGERPASAAFGAGFASLSRFYDMAAARFGMAPATVRAGGQGEVLVTAQGRSSLGIVTAAFSRRGVAAVRLSDSAADGIGPLLALFRHALLIDGGADFEALLAEVIAGIEEPAQAAELPLDIRGTAFEERVWAALRAIPLGTTATYGEIAAALGHPGAHRAVARACAANTIAVFIPCHRVIRADGSLAGYRWGVERKAALIAAERGDGGGWRFARSAPAGSACTMDDRVAGPGEGRDAMEAVDG